MRFNPRTHVGCDFHVGFERPFRRGFNPRTHVGCDLQMSEEEKANSSFQSTHPRGVRHYFGYDRAALSQFQSTHPRGVRPRSAHRIPFLHCFNPRTHVGCDRRPSWMTERLPSVSIHAPTWGATILQQGVSKDWSFNPRTHVGCD